MSYTKFEIKSKQPYKTKKRFNIYKDKVFNKIGETFMREDLTWQDLLDMDRIMDFVISNKQIDKELTNKRI